MPVSRGLFFEQMSSRVSRLALCGTGVLGLTAWAQPALAGGCGSGSNASVTTACTGPYSWIGGTLSNSGTISGGGTGVGVGALSVGTMTNTGTVSGTEYGIGIQGGGSVASISNASGATIHTSNTGAGANILVNGTLGTLSNSGLIQAARYGIDNEGSLTALYNNAGGTITDTNNGGPAAVSNNGTMTTIVNNGVINGAGLAIGNYKVVTGITNNGSITAGNGNTGILNATGGTVGTISNTGTITVNSTGGAGIGNGGGSSTVQATVGTIVNSGLITVTGTAGQGIYVQGAGLATPAVAFTTSGGGVTGSISNTGTIAVTGSTALGILNQAGSIGTLSNSGLITVVGPNSRAIYEKGTIGTVINSGTVAASGTGAIGFKEASIVVSKVGTGSGYTTSTVTSTVTSFINSGTVTVSGNTALGISNLAGQTIGSLTNSGFLVATGTNSNALSNAGTLSGINNSGTISGQNSAIANTGSLGTITNTGVIAGNISSTSAQDLTIGAGSGGTGTLTGYSAAIGTITVAQNLTLSSGTMLLNDRVTLNSGNGTLSNNATLQANQSLAIAGKYVQSSAGALVVGVSSGSSYGQLAVTGTADLTNGKVTLSALNGSTVAAQTYTIVSTTGGVTASGVTASAPMPSAASISGNNLIVTLTSWSQSINANNGGTGNIPVSPILDQLSSQPAFQTILSNLAAMSGGQQTVALKQLGVSQLTPQVNVGGSTVQPTDAAIRQRQTALLEGSESGKSAGSEFRDGAMWAQALGGRATRDTSAGADGYISSSYGLMAGGDLYFGDDLVGGLALSWLRNYAHGKSFSSGNSTQLDSFQLSPYGTWRPDGGKLFLQGLAGVAITTYDQSRLVGAADAIARAKYLGEQYQAKLGGGYDISLGGGVKMSPIATMQVIRVTTDKYRETSAGAANLVVKAQKFNSIESELGVRWAVDFETPAGLVSGDFHPMWVHGFTSSPVGTSAVMGGAAFVSYTARPPADGTRVSTGLTLKSDDAWSTRAEFDGDLRHDYRSYTGLLKVRYEFF